MRPHVRSALFLAITLSLTPRVQATFTVNITNPIHALAHHVKDAEFSSALNVIVSVSDSPAQLHIYDPETDAEFHVNLQLSPNCVSVSPDGLHAVVGHNGWISDIDLSTRTLVNTIPVAANIAEIVHGGNGFAYGFSGSGVRSINLVTGAETQSYTSRTPAAARLHPAHDRIYGADRNVSPDDIVRINMAAGLAGTSTDSIYHGDYAFCGNVWISMDGRRLVTACGNTFRASNDPASDMRFSGKLSEESRLLWAAHSQSGNSIAVLPQYLGSPPRTDNEIHYYSYDILRYRGKALLPSFVTDTNTWPARGRWLFFNAAGTKQYVLVQADAASGIVNDYGVVTIDCTSTSIVLDPSSAVIDAAAQTVAIDVTKVACCGWKAVSNVPWIETTSEGVGDGTVTLNVSANDSSSRTGTVSIGGATFTLTQNAPVTPPQRPTRSMAALPFRVIDSEYSKSLDAVIAVSDSPNRLHIYKPLAQSLVSVDLGATPFCVSVGPDGKFAAVGHDHLISYVDLENATLVKTLNTSVDVLDIILAANGYVYAFPRYDQWSSIRCINIASNTETPHTGNSIYAGTLARLHPGGAAIYGAQNNIYPSDIEKYDITAGTAAYKYDSIYHGDYSMCGNLWISEDGSRIYTACGNVFRSSTDRMTDIVYAGNLQGETAIRWASNSQAAGAIAIIPNYYSSYYNPPPRTDQEIHYFSPDFLVYQGKLLLPSFAIENASSQSRGRWHFFDATGIRQYAVVQSDPEAGMLNDFAVAMFDCTNAAFALDSAGANISKAGGNLQVTVTATDGCGWKAISNASWINTLSKGVGNGTLTMTVAENTSMASRSGTVSIGAVTFTIQQTGVVPVSIVATANSTTSVAISWSFGAADHYEVWRFSATGSLRVGTPTQKAFTEATAEPDSAYIYKVRAVAADGSMSDFGSDYAHTYTLTDAVLAGKVIRAEHVMELRTIVNAIRAAASRPPVTFTDASLIGVPAKRVHITELRDAINGLREIVGLTPYNFSFLPLNSLILESTTNEIRTALQ